MLGLTLLVCSHPAGRVQHLVSPDHKYVAYVVLGEAEVRYLAVTHADRLTEAQIKSQAEPYVNLFNGGATKSPQALVFDKDIHGIAWRANRPHELVYATSGLYGHAKLGLWTPKTGVRVLVVVRHPEDEAFRLIAVTEKMARYAYSANVDQGHYSSKQIALP